MKSKQPPPPARPVRYHLRVNLTPDHHVEEEKALWRILRRAKIDEALFFVPHAEERSPGLGTDADNEQMVAILRPLFAKLRQAKIAPSINIWWTVSFSEFAGMPRDQRDRFKFKWAVGLDGRPSVSVACPRCPTWRAQIEKMYQTYARLNPVRLWIDDDVRMTLRADLHCPCFCDDCLAEMTGRTGRKFTRAGLLKGILANPPNPVRDAWLAYQHDLEREIIAGLARALHAVSPETRVCLMHSSPEIHTGEGRRWGELVDVLGSPSPTFRPGIGPYIESTGPAIATGITWMRLTQAALPAGTAIAPEIENYPQSPFYKSAALVNANLMLAQLLGAAEVTFSIYRFGGRLDLETKREDLWRDRLSSWKPRLQAIADLATGPDQARGVSLYWHEEAARHARDVTDQPKPIFVYRQRPWDQVLPLLGIGTRYGQGDLTVFAGEEIACLTDPELREVFRHGVLLDARAAETLLLTGHGGLAGLRKRLPDTTAAIETIEDAEFGELEGDIINCRWTSQARQFQWQSGARIISRLRGHQHEDRGHGVVLFENTLGGRVIVVPFDSQGGSSVGLGIAFPSLESPSFICRPRQAQLRAALQWAGRGPLAVAVENSPTVYPLLFEQPRRLVIGAVNLLADPVESLVVRVRAPSFPLKRVRILTADGQWRAARRAKIGRPRGGAITIDTGISLPYLGVGVCVVE
ncbi:hypothetical protein HQ590_12765 [bacterium]|nr:hypothetical protein [bacterium]